MTDVSDDDDEAMTTVRHSRGRGRRRNNKQPLLRVRGRNDQLILSRPPAPEGVVQVRGPHEGVVYVKVCVRAGRVNGVHSWRGSERSSSR